MHDDAQPDALPPETLSATLQALLALTATDLPTLLTQLADVLSAALHAEKVDLFSSCMTGSMIAWRPGASVRHPWASASSSSAWIGNRSPVVVMPSTSIRPASRL
jgi:hypothetical protein